MKIFKFFSNDYILFFINFFIVFVIYINSILSENYNLIIEVLFICITYYFTSILTSFIIVFLLFFKIRNSFKKDMIVFSKLEIVAHIFDEYFDEINSIEDFELKLKEI